MHHETALRNFRRKLLAEVEAGRAIPTAATWILENSVLLQGHARELKESFSPRFWRKLAGKQAQPRLYRLTQQLVDSASGKLTIPELDRFFREFQRESVLSIAEMWAIRPMLKLAFLDRVLAVCGGGDLESAASEEQIRVSIINLRALDELQWNEFIESISAVDEILSQDPGGTYPLMEFETRDAYRHAVEALAERSPHGELDVARAAIDMAREAARHVGVFLVGKEKAALRKRLGARLGWAAAWRQFLMRVPNVFYIGGMALLTSALLIAAYWLLQPVSWWTMALLAIPLSQVALSVLNPLVNRTIPPRRLPRMDFSEGVPPEFRTFVVIPTLLLSRSGVENLLERIEIHFHANRDPNLRFGLLTDVPDAPAQQVASDELVELCAEGIRTLNRRYGTAGRGPFYLFHRERKWNSQEGVWMGYERKRGKLDAFNDFLLGRSDEFPVKAGDLSGISGIRYVITLDTDTQLPRDSARALIAAMAHPLNQPVLDAANVVREGYALMQPRVSISMESAQRSRLANLFSGQTGLDPYTNAVSDVYQDLFGQATYTGKGIYDLAAFAQVVRGRFPENTLLSHDLIEGEHARVGLITDLDVIDDFPASYEAFSKRKHRWVRGDWQIAAWLLPRVPDGQWRWMDNPLPLLSRWKIFDNLRRSLYEVSLLGFFMAGLFDWRPVRAAAMVLLVLAAPVVLQTFFSLLRFPPLRFWRGFLRETAWQFVRGILEGLVTLAFLMHQALLMADAIVRTLIRRLITGRKLLEWESAAQAETGGVKLSLSTIYLFVCPALATLIAFFGLNDETSSPLLPAILLTLWAASALSAEFVSHRMRFVRGRDPRDTSFLRDAGLRTWRYFLDFTVPEDHWLVPDNVQMEPYAVARRTSPTNMGLQLVADLAAYDFGYLTPVETEQRISQAIHVFEGMDRDRGHFFNWYDTRTLQPLPPRYISAVDSGNLAASLITVKQGCAEVARGLLVPAQTLAGLRDHCARLRNSLPPAARTATMMRALAGVDRHFASVPSDLFYWEGLISELQKSGRKLSEHVEWLLEHARTRKGESFDETAYWMNAFNGRIDALLATLRELAPWLTGHLEREVRVLAADPKMQPLMMELSRIPKLSELEAHYDAIEREAQERLRTGQPSPASRRLLEQLLEALPPARVQAARLVFNLERAGALADQLFHEMDFAFLLDHDRDLLRIGFDVDQQQPDSSYYDLLASEARTGVFLAVAKGDAPRETWFRLGRKLTSYGGYRTLLSWSGTMFEYLMPSLFMRTFEGSLLHESLVSAVRIQQIYCRSRLVPWGISEAAYAERDASLNHRYRAFGIPVMGLKRMEPRDLVVAPYASMLALLVDPHAATANLRHLAGRGWLAEYGFIESIDYSAGGDPVPVHAFMAHHQGMGFVALSNALLGNGMQRRFHAEPIVLAVELLLQERVPIIIDESPAEETLPVKAERPVAALSG